MYDIESNILSIEVAKGKIANTKEFGNFIIHTSANGKPLLIEILDASNFTKKFDILTELNNIKNLAPNTNQ
ncbi:DUF2283 domain-containing protein [Candidatus Parcubacteria bacterium]|nr:DUF2283 domain-containing protein [Patescibacteria group bacterium]MBU4308900.1 DUF2283 domain-containing protein [Patescibacteria group bacterium]MBU4432598.1 DUF2283 domain-containing protein [Patescibacteria group bacterium]MBU4577260.1 DUF2283 domain-containing protein [Patescibacteria group bacterium]MCG2696950.1 DUF2283 domain-containing protein [Candidatus Parcubacteria bacterium]